MTISNKTTLQELIDLGLFKAAEGRNTRTVNHHQADSIVWQVLDREAPTLPLPYATRP